MGQKDKDFMDIAYVDVAVCLFLFQLDYVIQ